MQFAHIDLWGEITAVCTESMLVALDKNNMLNYYDVTFTLYFNIMCENHVFYYQWVPILWFFK